MKVFHCDHCQHLVFFENIQCVKCEHALAYLPDIGDMVSLEPGEQGVWHSPLPELKHRAYRLCDNYTKENVCNWAVPVEDPNPLCASCRLTSVIPDISKPENKVAWYKLEIAKRRLVYTLIRLGAPFTGRDADAQEGLAFEFRADPDDGADEPVLTGHANGLITVNIAEADDAERERRKLAMHEPYRTILGHFRHESGHYYWDRLIRDSDRLELFRAQFGDERADYALALKQHYEIGAQPDWQMNFVSAYASVHPWEDWAETWAHYLHMFDTLETASACGLSLKPDRGDEPALPKPARIDGPFDKLMDAWFPLTYALNNLNRGLGLADAYPFVLSTSAVEKLRFIHDTLFGAK